MPGASSRWPTGTLRASAVGLSASQARMVDLIESAFRGAGYSVEVAAAAVVNAYAESRLSAEAVGDGGNSVGLFQLHMTRGAGRGYTRAQLVNPERNAAVLIARERAALAKVQALASRGAGLAAVAGAFSRYVERPAHAEVAAAYRAALAQRLFPFGLRTVAAAGAAPTAGRPWGGMRWWLAGSVAGALALVAVQRYLTRRRSTRLATRPLYR